MRLNINDIEIRNVGYWNMCGTIADKYHEDNKVFIVGDSAHSFPPAGGFGMNTGI